MSRLYFALILTLFSHSVIAQISSSVGFKNITIDKGSERPLNVAIWYPTPPNNNSIKVSDNAAFYGIDVINDGAPSDIKSPLVILSHGYAGSWNNLSWLASELVNKGYIVAAPNHPGTTTFNLDSQQAKQLRERPRDLSRVIDYLTLDPLFKKHIDNNNIIAIGHSLGGWTVVALAGGRFDTQLFQEDCIEHAILAACKLSSTLDLNNPALNNNMADPRITTVISLDAGLLRGFSQESLAKIQTPTLIIAAGIDIGDMPAKLESGYLHKYIPKDTSSYIELPDTTHFSFMQLCKPGAVALLDAEYAGEGIICKDGNKRNRSDAHKEMTELISNFMMNNMRK